LITGTTVGNTGQLFEYNCALRSGLRIVALAAPSATIPEVMKSRHIGNFDPHRFDDACLGLVHDILKLERLIPRRAETYRQSVFHGADVLKKLRSRLYGLNTSKVEQSRKMILDSYLQKTVVRQLSRVSVVPDGNVPLEGKYIWWQDDVESFQREEMFYGVICGQIAKTIADSEYEFLWQALQRQAANRATLVPPSQPSKTYAQIEDLVDNLLARRHKPNFILAPLELMADFLFSFHGKITWPAHKPEQLTLEKRPPLSLFWANNNMDANAFIIGDGHSLQWAVRPDDEDGALATAIGVSPLYKDKVDFFAQTEFKLDVLNPDAFQMVTLPKEREN
jgi:hypothetical protein